MKNKTIINITKNMIKELLLECSDEQQLMFKRMYCSKNLELSISDAVEQMSNDKIDFALTQIERTLEKNRISNKLK